jgi:hypothetical protein
MEAGRRGYARDRGLREGYGMALQGVRRLSGELARKEPIPQQCALVGNLSFFHKEFSSPEVF